jgi:glycosyltransferase involved in cell wall biosynthesis
MKIHIHYKFTDGPYGGGNQFLKALRSELLKRGAYASDIDGADICLFNGSPFDSYSHIEKMHDVFIRNPYILYIIRVDGPTVSARGSGLFYDKLIKKINNIYCDGIVFQSAWSRKQNQRITGIASVNEAVILNAADPDIFNPIGKEKFDANRKIRLIATSWSNNERKGFPVYEYLDNNMNWSKYAMMFVGNCPMRYHNIKCLQPISSTALADILRQNDIYLTASRNDACPNSLLEAMACGLPAIAFNHGGHPEMIGQGGVLYDSKEELPDKINSIVGKYDQFQNNIPDHSIMNVAEKYIQFGNIILGCCERSKAARQEKQLRVRKEYLKLRHACQIFYFYKRLKNRGMRLLHFPGM